ncbi:hypothetical protein Godav_025806 [Gossypium davidsonii]|uniref:Myb/SANT-like domain-containing protein n=2 Tax=Gossypium TaxID=3633 RepID=A0A7J8W9R1_9ROSI|nr:hypothetical protein [Gossypium davidsonii]MBA0671567.1 hypothetical protein [Gossypium klotzschianum]MBA0671570.1 hypothetical protein [Gossypium klotzschianum]
MLSGKDNSNFGWDEHRQMVVAEDASHKIVSQFRHRSFPFYDQLTSIYAKDRATGKVAQTIAYIVEKINAKVVATVNNLKEGNELPWMRR